MFKVMKFLTLSLGWAVMTKLMLSKYTIRFLKVLLTYMNKGYGIEI